MNPKISITVDAKNKATAVVSGIASVGAKIDVEVTGLLATNIPNWGADDDFTGPSLRFRLVDECGKDLVRFPIHKKTETSPDAWTESSNVFSATNVDFDTDVLRKAFCGVSFSDKLEFGVILDSTVDRAEYATGRMKVSQWRVASTEDPTILPDWRETLAKLTVDLASVEASKTAAAASATQASTYATNASTSASAASASASAASGSESRAAISVRHYPQVGLNGNWFVWDVDACQFVDSGKSACGYASWFFDSSDNKYHKVVITVNSLGEHCISVDQDGVSSVPAGDQYVDLSTNQTISGIKTFNSSPVVPTIESTDDNSTKSASTGWVTSKLTAWWNAIKGAAVSFSNSVTASGGFIGNLTGDVTGHASQDALDSEVVKLTGAQTINGSKIISSADPRRIGFKSTSYTREDVKSSGTLEFFNIRTVDKEDKTICQDYLYKEANSSTIKRMFSLNQPTVDNVYKSLLVLSVDENGECVINSVNTDKVRGSAFAAVGMPSSSYVDITLTEGAAYYTPPCNGFIMLTGISTNSNQRIRVGQNGRLSCQKWAVSSNQGLELFLPVVSNIQCSISMSVGTINICRFIKSNAEV